MIPLPLEHNLDETGILVLGASGFIGRWVAHGLAGMGLEPHLAVRDPVAFEPIRARWGLCGEVHAFDATAESSLSELLDRVRPGLVFNLVGYGIDRTEREEARAEALNGRFPEKLCDNLLNLREPVRLIHTGSALEYGRQSNDLNEETDPAPESLYGRTKLQGTRAVLQAAETGLDAFVARLFTVYGPGEPAGRLLPSLRRAAAEGIPVDLSDGEQRRDLAYVGEVAAALIALGALPDGSDKLFNLATGRLFRIREFILTASRLLNLPQDHLNFGAVARYADEMQHEEVAVERCRRLLGGALDGDLERGLSQAIHFEGFQS